MLILLIVLSLAGARVDVIQPELLQRIYRGKEMDYKIADIGSVPYGKSLVLELMQASPYDLCSVYKNTLQSQRRFALLVTRGNCHFSVKAVNAQLLGASMLVVVDNEAESKNLFMVENDVVLMHKVKIPVILISQKDGGNFL